MAHLRKRKRVITCQGTIQLIAALSVLNHRDRERGGVDLGHQDYLVIYDLCAPAGQTEEFVLFIRRMATLAHDWKSIVYIGPEQLGAIAQDLGLHGPGRALDRVYYLVGERDADEIYLSRNWQFANQLFTNAYETAEKVCYGDSIGIYFSEAYFATPEPKVAAAAEGFSIRSKLRGLRSKLSPSAQPRPALKEVEFDVGYFLLPDILGESPPMKTLPLEKAYSLELFQRLSGLLEEKHVARVRDRISGRRAVVLMTSNFSEAERMSLENEIRAYVKFLKSLACPPQSALIVKPHPRDSAAKIRGLRSAVGDLFSEVILLEEMDLFFLPFEIFLMRAFAGADGGVSQDLTIATFSTACLSLALLFDVQPVIGFGPDLVNEYFYETHAPGRDRHERDLRLAVQRISEGLYS